MPSEHGGPPALGGSLHDGEGVEEANLAIRRGSTAQRQTNTLEGCADRHGRHGPRPETQGNTARTGLSN